MNSRTLRILIVLGVVVLAAVFAGARWRERAKPKTEVGRTVTVTRGDMTVKVSENGTLEPVTQVDVKSRVAGRVLRVYVREGDTVRAGAPIASVDPTEVQRQVAGVEAQMASARAGLRQAEENYRVAMDQNRLAIRRAEIQLANARVGLRDAEVGLKQARAQLAQAAAPSRNQDLDVARATVRSAESRLANAKLTLTRRQNLVAKGFLSQSEADAAQLEVQVAEADLRSANERVDLLAEGPRKEDINASRVGIESAQVRVESARVAVESARNALATEKANTAQAKLRVRDVERARADIAQIENTLAQQNVQLSETRIVAPIGGEVIGKFIEEGELIASATAGFAQGAVIVSVADLSRMQVRVNINEVDVPRLKVGMPVEIRVDGLPGKVYMGRVAAISPASQGANQKGTSAQQSSGSTQSVVRFEVKISVENADRKLRPGMTAGVSVILDKKGGTLLLSGEALQAGDKVTVVTGEGDTAKKETRAVEVGLRNESTVEILSGLKEGDKVEVPKIDASDRRKINVNGPN